MNTYMQQGVVLAHSLDAVQPGDTVIIRAHGIPREDEVRLLDLGAHVLDATCPKVKQAQLAIDEATRQGTSLYLFGEAEHPEVQGLVSYANGPCLVFGSLKELKEKQTFKDTHSEVSKPHRMQRPAKVPTKPEARKPHATAIKLAI